MSAPLNLTGLGVIGRKSESLNVSNCRPCWARMHAGDGTTIAIGTGLQKKTVARYKQEWELYVKFCKRKGYKRVPGRDCRWSIETVRPYLQWRARTNNARSIWQIKSKLKHCGLCHDYLLPTARGEAPAKLRLQLAMISKEINKREQDLKKKAGMPTGPKRSLALGKVAVGMLFSAYGATTRKGFRSLPREVKHYLAMCVCMHTGCMRFQLIRELFKKGKFRWSQAGRQYMIASDWDKMKRRTGHYTVKFAMEPKFAAMKYAVYGTKGEVVRTFTAARVLRWHIAEVGTHEAKNLFAPDFGEAPSSRKFKAWLRSSFRALLTGESRMVEAMVEAITPHSFRAGLASDLEREDVPRSTTKKLGRWSSTRAMEQYMRDGLAQRLQRIRYYKIACRGSRVKRISAVARKVSTRKTDESEGYEDSEYED